MARGASVIGIAFLTIQVLNDFQAVEIGPGSDRRAPFDRCNC